MYKWLLFKQTFINQCLYECKDKKNMDEWRGFKDP